MPCNHRIREVAMAVARFVVFGGIAGLAWAAALRAYMVVIAGWASHFDWYGTYVAILLPGALVGGLLGWAESRRRRGLTRGWGLLAASPLLFAVFVLVQPGALVTFVTTGLGGGALGVPLALIALGFALSGRGRRWPRVVVGVLGLLLVAVIGVAPLVAQPGIELAERLWAAILGWSLMLVGGVAASAPFRPVAVRALQGTSTDST